MTESDSSAGEIIQDGELRRAEEGQSEPGMHAQQTWVAEAWRNLLERIAGDNDINWDAERVLGRTPLIISVFLGLDQETRTILSEFAPDVNAKCRKGYTCLHLAVFHGRVRLLELLLTKRNKRLLESQTFSEKYNVLHLSTFVNGNESMMPLLVESYGDLGVSEEEKATFLNARDSMKRTPLHYAVLQSPMTVVGLLLKYDTVEVNAKDADGFTPWHIAVLKKRQDVVKLLAAHREINLLGKVPRVKVSEVTFPSFKSLRASNARTSAFSFQQKPRVFKETPGFLFCLVERRTVVSIELPAPESIKYVTKSRISSEESRISPEERELDFAKHSALYYAIENLTFSEAVDVLEMFLTSHDQSRAKHVADELTLHLDPPEKPAGESTLLHLLTRMERQELLSSLLLTGPEVLGADFVFSENVVETIFHGAAFFGHVEVAKVCFSHDHGRNRQLLESKTLEGCSALHFSAFGGHKTMVSCLLKSYARLGVSATDMEVFLNARDIKKRTPLHYAAMNKSAHTTKILLLFDAVDVNAQDDEGYTALHFAALLNCQHIVRCLLKHPAINLQAKVLQTSGKDVADMEQSVMETIEGSEKVGKIRRIHLNLPLRTISYESRKAKTAKINYNFKENEKEVTAIRCAVAGQTDPNLLEMLKIGTARMGTDQNRKTAQEIIQEIIYELQQRRSKPNILHLAASQGDVELVGKLSSTSGHWKLDINERDAAGQTSLYLAVEGNHTNLVKYLLDQPNIKAGGETSDGGTPLMIAVEKDHRELELLLLARDDVKDEVADHFRDRQVAVDGTNTVLVGAALIASITYGGFLQPPLGYTPYYQFSNPYPAPPTSNPSYAAVYQSRSVRVFWIFNSISFFFAIASVLCGAASVLRQKRFIGEDVRRCRRLLTATSSGLICSVLSVLVAFIAAGFASLPPILEFQEYMIVATFYCICPCLVALCFFLNPLLRNPSSQGRLVKLMY